MITAQEARDTRSDRYLEIIQDIEWEIRRAIKFGCRCASRRAPYDEHVLQTIKDNGFTVSYSPHGEIYIISW